MRIHHTRRVRRQGFTLLEILIVLAIIGVIAAMAVPRLLGQQREANVKITKQAIANLQQAVEIYAVGNNGEPPQTIDLLLQPAHPGAEPILDKVPVDAWGQPLFYEYPNTKASTSNPAIWSGGPNRKNDNGGGDDINNWDELIQSR
jgi:general secretion pathway protein G